MKLLTARRPALLAGTAVSALLCVAVASAPPAAAGAFTMTVDPTTVTAGASTHVSSTECTGEGSEGTVDLGLYAGSTGGTTLPGGSPVSTATVVASGGDWDTDLNVPSTAAPGTYTVHAHCTSNINNFSYANVQITVVAGATTTTTTTTLATTTTAGATTTTTASKPAPAVSGQPTFTG